jgi:two-component system sensor histidine kinase KdpD
MFLLDGHIDLGNQALILVLASALAALWLPGAVSMAVCAAAVLAFNYSFVPPRHQFSVDFEQHALLLVTMLAVSWLIALMVDRQRRLTATERMYRERAEQLRGLGDVLRDADDPTTRAARLQATLSELTGAPVALLLLADLPSDELDARDVPVFGQATPEERVALWLAVRQSSMTGGTEAAEEPLKWYLPMRGRNANYGAALLRFPFPPPETPELREHAQALCDQMGLAIERSAALRAATAAREAAQAQALRNTLLAAIAHDHRTPLATILGAGSSLLEQSEKLAPEQRARLAAAIVDEATQLARLTDNTLQLARLDTPGLSLRLDWESIEELVGTVVRRVRQRDAMREVRIAIEPALPLVRCDAVLLVQLLDNLVDNAFKYGGGEVGLRAFRRGDRLVLAVDDRGSGVPAEWRVRIFEVFQRAPAIQTAAAPPRGAGVGLAVCRAIARAHGGELSLHDRAGGGSSFELSLPIAPLPPGRLSAAAEHAT